MKYTAQNTKILKPDEVVTIELQNKGNERQQTNWICCLLHGICTKYIFTFRLINRAEKELPDLTGLPVQA